MRSDHKPRKGMVLVLIVVAMTLLLAATGLAVDCSRILITKGISQGRMDAAALAAVLELDGTRQGIQRARQAATSAAEPFWAAGLKIEFSTDANGPWEENPRAPGQHRLARVRSSVQVPLTLLQTMVRRSAIEFGSVSTGAQQKSDVPRDILPDSKALSRRFDGDTDFSARSYAEYASRGRGNGRRIIPTPEGARFILPASGNGTVHETEPAGAYLQGSRWKGAGDSGYFVAVLLR